MHKEHKQDKMTSHELARLLLAKPNKPIVAYQDDEYRYIKEISDKKLETIVNNGSNHVFDFDEKTLNASAVFEAIVI